jgi:anti-anti-sigma regulatory factor
VIDYLSSAGMRAFFVATKESEKTGCKIAFFGFSKPVADMMHAARVDKYLATFSDKVTAEKFIAE